MIHPEAVYVFQEKKNVVDLLASEGKKNHVFHAWGLTSETQIEKHHFREAHSKTGTICEGKK